MIDERKVRLMTEAAMIEEKDEQRIFITRKFYSRDYALFQSVKAVIGVSIAYFLILFVIFIGNLETFTTQFSVNGLMWILRIAIIVYLGLAVLTIILSTRYSLNYFKKSRSKLKRYHRVLKEIEKEYGKEEPTSQREEHGQIIRF